MPIKEDIGAGAVRMTAVVHGSARFGAARGTVGP